MANQAISSIRGRIESIDRALQRLQDSKALMEEQLAQQMHHIAPVRRLHDDLCFWCLK